jgi:hypothetical protein
MGVANFPAKDQLARRGNFRMLAMAEWYFIWLDGPRGPEPQKWSADGLWAQLARQDVIVRFALSDREADLTLDLLAKLHPIPR